MPRNKQAHTKALEETVKNLTVFIVDEWATLTLFSIRGETPEVMRRMVKLFSERQALLVTVMGEAEYRKVYETITGSQLPEATEQPVVVNADNQGEMKRRDEEKQLGLHQR